jgi:hypothetical protein
VYYNERCSFVRSVLKYTLFKLLKTCKYIRVTDCEGLYSRDIVSKQKTNNLRGYQSSSEIYRPSEQKEVKIRRFHSSDYE